jgi:hypothetical protein
VREGRILRNVLIQNRLSSEVYWTCPRWLCDLACRRDIRAGESLVSALREFTSRVMVSKINLSLGSQGELRGTVPLTGVGLFRLDELRIAH